MRKLFLMLSVVTLIFSSCSKDDDNSDDSSVKTKELKVTIDGVQKTFNTIVVNEETVDYGGGEIAVEYTVTATINNSATEYINFIVDKDDVGANVIYDFVYSNGQNSYNQYNGNGTSFSTVVETNANKVLKGSFSGTLGGWDNNEQVSVTMTNGTFNINFN